MRIKLFDEVFFDVPLVEELLWDEVLLFEEPHEYETGDKTDATLVVELVIVRVGGKVVRETCHLHCPGIPVAEL